MRKTFEQRCAESAQRAVGCNYRIAQKRRTQTGGKVIVSGKIVECTYIGDRNNTAFFRVVMECGPNKNRETFTVKRLPRK